MPYKKSYLKKRKPYLRRRRQARTGAPITRAPRLTRKLRVYNNLTRDCRWFKHVKFITSDPDNIGRFSQIYRPGLVTECLDFQNWGRCWEQYKVLQVSVHFIPAAIGSESLQQGFQDGNGFPTNIATFKRGEVVIYMDQGAQDPVEPDFARLITKPSARLYSARQRVRRFMTRPRGNPEWGEFSSQDGTVQQSDSWSDSYLHIQGQNFTPLSAPGNQLWYWVQINYKVLFRGRQRAIPLPAAEPVATPTE